MKLGKFELNKIYCGACVELHRHFLGFEINPEYVEIANRRLSEVQVSMI